MEDQIDWETLASRHEQEWQKVWSNNHETGQLVYWKDVVPYKHLARLARLKENQPVCWGAVDCLDKNLTKCAAGKHDTCKHHATDCFVCGVEKSSRAGDGS